MAASKIDSASSGEADLLIPDLPVLHVLPTRGFAALVQPSYGQQAGHELSLSQQTA